MSWFKTIRLRQDGINHVQFRLVDFRQVNFIKWADFRHVDSRQDDFNKLYLDVLTLHELI